MRRQQIEAAEPKFGGLLYVDAVAEHEAQIPVYNHFKYAGDLAGRAPFRSSVDCEVVDLRVQRRSEAH